MRVIGSDSPLRYDLLDQEPDLSRISPPLLPLLEDLLAGVSVTRWPHASVFSFSRDVSREGPFNVYCMPSDTGNHPLISEGLPGCPYRMTSYSEEDIADVDLAFGMQLHNPRFLECIGAPESARLLGSAPAELIRTMNR